MEVTHEIRGLESLSRALTDHEKKILPRATRDAINDTTDKIQKNIQGAMQHFFDRPTRWTLNSMWREKATTRKQFGRVRVKDKLAVGKGNPASEYLRPQIEGGTRKYKPFEAALFKAGLLPRGWYVVPAKGPRPVRLNRYGNISGGMHTKILSDLRAAEHKAGYTMNRAAGTPGKFFVALPRVRMGKRGFEVQQQTLPPGIYRRLKRGVRAVFIFVKKTPYYKKRLPFHEIAKKTYDRNFERSFGRSMDKLRAGG